jgi:hypothetical protein
MKTDLRNLRVYQKLMKSLIILFIMHLIYYATDFTWSSDDKANTCASVQPTHKSRQDEIKFSFDVAICDRIFDELLNLGEIKISHTLQPNDEIKKHAYCKFHHSYSHSTNDCNSFHRQIQSAINEGCLVLHKMQVDQNPFPVNALMSTIELIIPKVLIRPDQVEKARGKNIIIGEKRPDEKLSLEERSPRLQRRLQRLGGKAIWKRPMVRRLVWPLPRAV